MIEAGKRRVLSGKQVQVSNQPIRVGGGTANVTSAAATEGNTSSVREIRDAHGNISEIHVQCECGCVTVLQCDYAN
jgi:hypothetical protein